MTAPIGPKNIIDKKKNYLYPCTQHFYQNPPQIVKGSMQYVYDSTGKQYVDFFSGVSVMNCGHSNPYILDRTIHQLKELQHMSTIYLTQPMVDLGEKLASILPGSLQHSFFCCTGSEANEGALLLARLYSGKKNFIALENSLHGRTNLTMSVTSIPMWRTDLYLDPDVTIIPNAYQLGKSSEEAAKDSIYALEKLLGETKSKHFAALIAEPIQGNGGIITPPQWYFKKLIEILHEHNILLIMDEVQTGFGRCGSMFASEKYGVVPDILTTAKALGNGMPISAFCTTPVIASSLNKPSASTLGGNPVSSATALAVIDYIQENRLWEKAEDLGGLLKEGLLELKDKYSIIHDVRGLGLMLGVELLTEDRQPASKETDEILEYLKDNGILLGKNGLGRNVLAFQPPLVISKEDVKCVLDVLDHGLSFISA